MLHQIIEHARSKNLDVEPGFTPKFVKWAIQCDSRGRFLGLLPLAGKKEKGREFSKCPNMTQPEMVIVHPPPVEKTGLFAFYRIPSKLNERVEGESEGTRTTVETASGGCRAAFVDAR